MSALQPCPFCRRTDGLDLYGTLAPRIWCGNCDRYGPPVEPASIPNAHAAWNAFALAGGQMPQKVTP